MSETLSGSVKLLGLKLGYSVDDNVVEQRESVWKQLQRAHSILEYDYGIRHNDAENGRNSIFIDD